MPFRSYKQVTYLKKKKPSIYRRWKKKYGIKPIPKIKRIGGK